MIKHILELLRLADIGNSETIDIAKGKYKLPENINEFKKQLKWQSKRK
jgi:hypothetical protein